MMWCRRVAQVTKHPLPSPPFILRGHYRSHLSAQTSQQFNCCVVLAFYDKWSSIVTGDGQWTEIWDAGYFHQEHCVSCVNRLKVSKSNSGVFCACLTCIMDNYPEMYNQQGFVHWGKNRNGYFTKDIGFTYSLGKIIRELIRSC